MVIAEIKGKIPKEFEYKEDILTSNVFSFFNYSRRQYFLGRLLEILKLKVTKESLESAEFIFWPTYPDGTEPDLIIIVGNYYLLFEAKYTSGFGQKTEFSAHQLEREHLQGSDEAKRLGKEFRLIAVTKDIFVNDTKYPDIPNHLRKEIRWLNWQRITYLLEEIILENKPLYNRELLFLNDLHDLLVKKGLRSFEGIKLLSKLKDIDRIDGNVFYDVKTSLFRGEFIGFIDHLIDEEEIAAPGETIFLRSKYNGQK